jgi:DUF4097 and DUF4098 domain-containing protein YvlB
MKDKYKATVILSVIILISLVVISSQRVLANGWEVINDTSWCDEGSIFFGKTVCEVRELTISEAWKKITVDASPNGGIKVEGWDEDSIRIQARVQAKAKSLEKAKELISDIDIKTNNSRIRADGPTLFNSKRSWSVSYRLMVPQESNLKLKALNGGISIHNVDGQIYAKSLNGGIDLNGLTGDVEARTTNGGISVELDGDRWQGRGLDANTTNGGIKLTVPDNYSAELEVGTVNGGIKIDFPITVQGWINKRIETTLGEGGAIIKATTTNGGVVVERQ